MNTFWSVLRQDGSIFEQKETGIASRAVPYSRYRSAPRPAYEPQNQTSPQEASGFVIAEHHRYQQYSGLLAAARRIAAIWSVAKNYHRQASPAVKWDTKRGVHQWRTSLLYRCDKNTIYVKGLQRKGLRTQQQAIPYFLHNSLLNLRASSSSPF